MKTAYIAVAIGLAATIGTSSANAHQSSFTYGRLDVSEDKRVIDYSLKIKSSDLFEAIELDRDRDASDDEIRAGAQKLDAYVAAHVTLETGDVKCERSPGTVSIEGKRDRYAVLAIRYQCEEPVVEIALDYQLFFNLDDRHIGLLLVDDTSYQLSAPDHTRFEWTIGSPIEGGLGFIRSGIDHIIFGLDHILFLFALLLMVVVTRSEKGGWKLRPAREGLAYTAAVVTSFTIAHSITLIAAALGWIDLPSRLVESVIAASIVYVAVENVLRPDPPRRYAVTFIFGLIHGLGFASMLRPLLPPDDVVGPLLLFNIGVELGQLGIVLVALPLLYGLAKLISADKYRSVVLPIGAALLGLLGAIWLVERAFEISIFGF